MMKRNSLAGIEVAVRIVSKLRPMNRSSIKVARLRKEMISIHTLCYPMEVFNSGSVFCFELMQGTVTQKVSTAETGDEFPDGAVETKNLLN
jgi:hypothetical protein